MSLMLPVPKHWVRAVAYVGIVVCCACAVAEWSMDNYRDAGAYAFFLAANVVTLIMYRRR